MCEKVFKKQHIVIFSVSISFPYACPSARHTDSWPFHGLCLRDLIDTTLPHCHIHVHVVNSIALVPSPLGVCYLSTSPFALSLHLHPVHRDDARLGAGTPEGPYTSYVNLHPDKISPPSPQNKIWIDAPGCIRSIALH